ncbi:MAG: hypothetical protein OZ921_05420, partial [Sorangiineae bacterium]|nr:hypothetical protein [Sorangiineae bacterium]
MPLAAAHAASPVGPLGAGGLGCTVGVGFGGVMRGGSLMDGAVVAGGGAVVAGGGAVVAGGGAVVAGGGA